MLGHTNLEAKLVRSHPVRNKFTSLECPHARPDVSFPTKKRREIALSSLTLSLPFYIFRDDCKIVSSIATRLEMKMELFKEIKITLN